MPKLPDFISIIIPGYNEEKRIARSLLALSAFCEEHFEKYEIVFVNDGSTDKTKEIVEKLSTLIQNVQLNRIKERVRGQGDVTSEAYRFSPTRTSPWPQVFPKPWSFFIRPNVTWSGLDLMWTSCEPC
jgi:cellulose synthase/poly-beta-1,6-N-acetylglucosamine synthase-like glycosyltransferase